jgi:hypothetical protein
MLEWVDFWNSGYLSAHFIHMIASMAITIDPDAMNTAIFCQKSKLSAKKAR